MNRCVLALAAWLISIAPSNAHFVYLVPDNGAAIKAVFSDTLKPDDKVNVEKIENTKLFVLDASGKESTLKWTLDKAASCYKIEAPAGARIVAGVTDYGVLQRGDSKPFWLKYYSKTILGGLNGSGLSAPAALGERVPLEIVPIVSGGKIRFQAIAGGKPIPKAQITVIAPGDDKSEPIAADEKGLTPEFSKAGTYGVNLRRIEAKSGEEKGKKFEEFRSYATLVVHFEPGK